MSKDCEKYKAIILAEDNHLDRETCDHIAGCPECEALASAWMSLKNVRLPGDGRTLPDLDFSIISRSDRFAGRSNLKKTSSALTKIIYFTAAAACMLLVSWLIVSYNVQKKNDTKELMSWNSASINRDMVFMESNLELVRRDISSSHWQPEYKLIDKKTEKLFGLK